MQKCTIFVKFTPCCELVILNPCVKEGVREIELQAARERKETKILFTLTLCEPDFFFSFLKGASLDYESLFSKPVSRSFICLVLFLVQTHKP